MDSKNLQGFLKWVAQEEKWFDPTVYAKYLTSPNQ